MIQCLQLFIAFLQIGAFSFGGGYAAMPLIQEQIVNNYGWLTMSDLTDLITISEMTPGPIAVNTATFVGNNIAGVPGALFATFGCILPSCVFVTFFAYLYNKYRKMRLLQGILSSLHPAVIAMIFSAGLRILIPTLFTSGTISFLTGNFQIHMFILFLVALFLLMKLKWNPILVMILSGITELTFQMIIKLI